jgi:pimeloyl-ACP methyl ester carboxylesterase
MSATLSSEPTSSARKSSAGKWLLRAGLALFVIVLLMGVCGLVYQATGAAGDAQNFPPPGQLVAVGDLQMHLHCSGSGLPTVILESMAGSNSMEWGWIQPEVSQFTRVCAYDRAGIRWSDTTGTRRSAQEIVDDLHTLLANAQIEPPYVLVGHSIGGVYARMFEQEYPEEVLGLVLVDSSHPEQVKRYPALRAGMESYANDAQMSRGWVSFGSFLRRAEK